MVFSIFTRACGVFLLTAGLLAGLIAAMPLIAQETQPPELPETRVVAEPAPETYYPDDGLTGTLFDGTVFDSPMAYGYNAGSNTVGGIIDIPNLNFAGTADIITSPLIADQQALQFNDILRDIPAAAMLNDPNFPDRFLLRGYEVQSRDFRKDGFIDSTFTPRDFQNIERVEILKGPASVLYGGMSPAGTINLITKKPVYGSFTSGGYQFGSFGLSRGTFDANGFVGQSDNVLMRINGALQTTDSFRDFGYINRGIIAPTMTWLIDDCTSLTVAYEYHKDHRRPDHGNLALGGNPFAFPDDVYFGEPGNDFSEYEDNRISIMLTEQLSDWWTFRIGATGLFYNLDSSQTAAINYTFGVFNPFNPPVNPPQQFDRVRDVLDVSEQADSLIANLTGEFDTGDINHKVLIGTEQVYFESNSTNNQFNMLEPQFDPNNPAFGVGFASPIVTFGVNSPLFKQIRSGVYAQDLMEIGDRWFALAGVRYDHLDLRFDRSITFFGATFPVPPTDQTYDRWSPRAGLVYQAIPDVLSYYFSYTKSFTPPGGIQNPAGGDVFPEFGELYEAGFKVELLDCLALTACGFHTQRRNVSIGAVFDQDGIERTQGAEVNLVGNITDYWSVIANYAYTDTKLRDPDSLDPTLVAGVQQRNVPYNSSNIWTRYNLIDNGDEVFGLALGMVALGHRFGNLDHSVRLPGFARWDAGAYYNRGSFMSSLYIENFLDRRYAATALDESTLGIFPGVNVMPGAPINVRANLGFCY